MCKRLLKLTGVLTAALILSLPIPAAEIYVAPDGDDANPGTREAPVQTLAAVRDAVDSAEEAVIALVHSSTTCNPAGSTSWFVPPASKSFPTRCRPARVP